MEEETQQLKLRTQRTISLGDDSSVPAAAPVISSDNALLSRREDAVLPSVMIRSTFLWLSFGFFAWQYPRYLISTDKYILKKTPPYQKTFAGDVILDFSLNEKVSDPPIIPSAYNILLSIGSS